MGRFLRDLDAVFLFSPQPLEAATITFVLFCFRISCGLLEVKFPLFIPEVD